MSDQSKFLQDLERVLQENGVQYQLQRADVVDGLTTNGETKVLAMDVELRILNTDASPEGPE